MLLGKLILIVSSVFIFGFSVCEAKPADEQNQIILLNDSSSALEDTDPGLSKQLASLAMIKEKKWEQQSASKTPITAPTIDKVQVEAQIKIIRQAATEIGTIYPLITKALLQMANDLEGELKNAK